MFHNPNNFMRGFYCEVVHKNCKTKDGVRFSSTEHHDIIVMIASPRQTQLRLTPTYRGRTELLHVSSPTDAIVTEVAPA